MSECILALAVSFTQENIQGLRSHHYWAKIPRKPYTGVATFSGLAGFSPIVPT